MKYTELIALGIAGVALFLIVKGKANAKTSVSAADGPIPRYNGTYTPYVGSYFPGTDPEEFTG